MRVSDYITQTLVAHGITKVFLVTGGGSMHLNDAIGRCKGLEWTCCHHEQACAMAAESYARLTGNPAAVNVTTGPGGTNAITGVYGAYVDSIPMIIISGQVKRETLNENPNLRQLGDQEVNITNMVAGITKMAVVLKEPTFVKYQLERAIYLCKSGRPGPCWIDVPIDVQGAIIEPSKLIGYTKSLFELVYDNVPEACEQLLIKLTKAKRPVILVGAGVRISGTHEQFIELVNKLGIPVVTGWNAHDAIWNDHPLYVGRPGTVGDRAGNFAVQNSDLLLVLGSRLNIRQISYNWKSFAPKAYKIMVDIDATELNKPTLTIDLPIHADLRTFIPSLNNYSYTTTQQQKEWLKWCLDRKNRYPVVLPTYWNNVAINPYCFIYSLFKQLEENEIIVSGDGTACVTSFQAANLKKGQRLYTNSGCASMGYDLPAAIGAYYGSRANRIICLAGDGSIQMNIQELQTIVANKIPAKIFILNNEGYHSIRQTQNNYFPDNTVGCGLDSGLSFPNFKKIAAAYGISYKKINKHKNMSATIKKVINAPGPQICEVMLDLTQQFAPKLSSRKLPDGTMISSPLEDMAPFLSREELKENMIEDEQ